MELNTAGSALKFHERNYDGSNKYSIYITASKVRPLKHEKYFKCCTVFKNFTHIISKDFNIFLMLGENGTALSWDKCKHFEAKTNRPKIPKLLRDSNIMSKRNNDWNQVAIPLISTLLNNCFSISAFSSYMEDLQPGSYLCTGLPTSGGTTRAKAKQRFAVYISDRLPVMCKARLC